MARKTTTTRKAAGGAKRAIAADASAPKVVNLRPADGLANVITGMGMLSGKRGGDSYSYNPLDDGALMDLYRSSWMARKAVDIIAEDMTKAWRTWQLKPKQVTDVWRAEVDLQLRFKLRDAIRWGRLLGGGALIVGDGRNSETPLVAANVAKGGLKYILAVPRTVLDAGANTISWNPSHEWFGQPEFYHLRLRNTARGQADVRIHWSRVFRFFGAQYPEPMLAGDPWSDSILQSVWETIRDADLALQSAAGLVEEAKTDIVTMENLESHLATQDSNARLLERMRLFKLGKSSFNIALMGGRETFDSKQIQFSNLDKVLFTFLQVVSGATDIPATRFLAQSPAGMNSTGESDLRNYASLIKSKQEDAEGSLRRLDELLLRHALGSIPKTWAYEWNSIWTMSPKEAAETNKLLAEADQAYANSGMIPTAALEKAITARMIDSGLYPGLDEAMQELDEDELEKKRPDPAIPPLDPNKDPASFGNTGGDE